MWQRSSGSGRSMRRCCADRWAAAGSRSGTKLVNRAVALVALRRLLLLPSCCPLYHTAPSPHLPLLLLSQAEQHEREAALLAEAAEDPAREAEVALLRDDCAYLKARRWKEGALPPSLI